MNRVRGTMLNKGLQKGLLSRFRFQGFKGFHTSPRLSTIHHEEEVPKSHLQTLVDNHNEAALSIAGHIFLHEEYQNKNVVFSPLSLHVALSMVAAGSKGATLKELHAFLLAKCTHHLNSFASEIASIVLRDAAPVGGPRLYFANGVWVEQSLPIHPSFKQLVTTDYNANFASVDFQNKAREVANQVNLWAESNTNGLIKDILFRSSVSRVTRLMFANALYFKGTWIDKFDALRTKDRDFHLLNDTSVKVPFMTSKESQYISVFKGFKVLRLPYDSGDDERQFSIYIFLPNANDGLSALVKHMAIQPEFVERHLPHDKVNVRDFRIPKFKISSRLDVSNVVKEMGLCLPFSERQANLEKMVKSCPGEQNLYVSNILQKCFVEVNEEGTKAAAVTTIQTTMHSSYSNKGVDFVADHPFVFLIREDLTGTPLFIGQVLHPLHE